MKYIYTRKELYDLVWAEPRTILSEKFGISDVALSKICRKKDIPVPQRGYWAKKDAGKPAIKIALPPRFPGMSDTVEIGRQRQNTSVAPHGITIPDPAPPVFEESLSFLQERVSKMVGKVAVSRLTTRAHHTINRILEGDEKRKKAILEHGYSWDAPRFVTPTERRKLTIINAIFITTHRLGCKPYIAYPKFGDNELQTSFQVSDYNVLISLNERVINRKNGRSKEADKKILCLTIIAVQKTIHFNGDGKTLRNNDSKRD